MVLAIVVPGSLVDIVSRASPQPARREKTVSPTHPCSNQSTRQCPPRPLIDYSLPFPSSLTLPHTRQKSPRKQLDNGNSGLFLPLLHKRFFPITFRKTSGHPLSYTQLPCNNNREGNPRQSASLPSHTLVWEDKENLGPSKPRALHVLYGQENPFFCSTLPPQLYWNT